MIIPFGGTNPLGTAGFVNAAFELADQIKGGILPEPDVVYVAFGSMGTAVGLALGLKAAGLGTHVEAVRVVPETLTDMAKGRELALNTAELLHEGDTSFPLDGPESMNIAVRDEFYGGVYARFTREGIDAIRRVRETEGLTLEGTYTGKTFAALIRDAAEGRLRDKTVLFWNTYNSRDAAQYIQNADYRELPRAFHRYFEEDVQPLDGETA